MKDSPLTRFPRVSPRRHDGFTLLESLVVLAVIGILSSVLAASLRPPDATLFSRAASETIGEARFLATARSASIAVAWNPANRAIELSEAAPSGCSATGDVLRSVDADDYARLSVDASDFPTFLWRANGLPHFCEADADGVTLAVSDRRARRELTIDLVGTVDLR